MPNKLDTALKATSSLFKLTSGLYIVRMGQQKPSQKLNPVTLSQAPSEGGCVDFFPAEKVLRNTLVNPGDCIVLRVKGEGATLVASEFHEGKPTTVKLQVERIDAPTQAQPASAAPAINALKTGAVVKPLKPAAKAMSVVNDVAEAPEAATTDAIGIGMVGHIQNKGDVVVKNDWLGKPGTPNRLEGFAIKAVGLPEGVNLVYGVKFQSAAYKPQMSKEGKFVGTRKKAQGIQSVVFALDGEAADQYQISGDVAFSGGVGCNIVANQELKGPQGNEHLVGINLKINKKPAAPEAPEEEDGLWTEEDIRELFSL